MDDRNQKVFAVFSLAAQEFVASGEDACRRDSRNQKAFSAVASIEAEIGSTAAFKAP